jgi:hypothetical protein
MRIQKRLPPNNASLDGFVFAVDFRAPSIPRFSAEWVGSE